MARTNKTADMAQALSRLSLRDMLVVPETADLVLQQLTQHANTDVANSEALEVASRESLEMAYGYSSDDDEDARKPFVYQDGIAVIPVHGTLINRFNSSWGFVTGYNYIRRMMNAALDDDDVEQIVLDIDSPGGEASGCFELGREIMAARRVKPILAMVDSLSASGGYALTCVATTVYAIPSARIGSIGVYRMHVSYEQALKNEGIKVTFATAGDFKVDGNPYQDLPQRVLDEWRESAGQTWDDFIALVAEGRDISDSAVRDTQARVYRADEALAKGLIDAVKTPTEAVAAFLAELAEDNPSEEDGDDDMTDTKTKGAEATSGLSAADLEKIGTMISTAVGGVANNIARQTQIKDYAASKGKAFVARGSTLASDDNISFDSAKKIIDAAAPAGKVQTKGKGQRAADPDEDDDDAAEDDDDDDDGDDTDTDDEDDDGEEAADAARKRRQGKSKVKAKGKRDTVNHFDKAMGNDRHPEVGAGGERKKGKGGEATAADLLADHAAATGAGWSTKAAAGNA